MGQSKHPDGTVPTFPTLNSQGTPPHLLVVDDETAQMTALCNTLEDAGYLVSGFTSALKALAALRERKFDLVLTDLKMPEMDGISFLKAAQSLDSNLVGIVMTGHAAIDTAIEAMKAGAIDYVVKPFKLSIMLPVLSRALEVRRMRLEIVELQQRLRQHVSELEAANRELEMFSYSVSHDLRSPLRAISSFSNMLIENYSAQMPSDAQRLLSKVTTSARRMGQLIEDLLRFSRLHSQPLSRSVVNVSELVQEVVSELNQESTPRQIDIRIGELPDAVGDATLLRQVFFNLLANAYKFTRTKEQPLVEVDSRRDGREQIFLVRDNGAGFDMQYADKLFGVFQRLHSAAEFEGTGIGLSLAQRIIERHGGRIWAEAAVNEGATFYFSLPS